MYNEGTGEVYIDIDNTATTDSFMIPSGAFLALPLGGLKVHAICSTDKTATLRCWAFR